MDSITFIQRVHLLTLCVACFKTGRLLHPRRMLCFCLCLSVCMSVHINSDSCRQILMQLFEGWNCDLRQTIDFGDDLYHDADPSIFSGILSVQDRETLRILLITRSYQRILIRFLEGYDVSLGKQEIWCWSADHDLDSGFFNGILTLRNRSNCIKLQCSSCLGGLTSVILVIMPRP